ncbi:MAG: urea carboxylase [Alphaproteobacteria bacterium]|nr:urea carboxylase [Alphaproteobacteria bacterium]
MFEKVLIANRGEIACRVIRTLRRMGIASVAVYSEADRHARHVLMADEAVCVGPAPAAESYLNQEAIVAACEQTGAQAVHPGYGFLSENPGFAERLALHGIRFIGPRPQHMRRFGLKHTAREIAEESGVPLLPGTGLLDDEAAALEAAGRIGYPVMLKSSAGGGGIGMQLCHGPSDLKARFEAVRQLSRNNFGDAGLFLEKFVAKARHIEVQIFGDGRGAVIALGERDCSLQRRNQKVVEETPAPNLPTQARLDLHAAAIALGKMVDYESAGTVEFVYDVDAERFYFLEVNTRLQVEHCVTEEVFGVDLVEWMLRQAAGEFPALAIPAGRPSGTAIEVRLYAEDPAKDFRPAAGRLTAVKFPCNVRVDGWVESGTEVPPYYDPMLAKLIVTGRTRAAAVRALSEALGRSQLYGIETNLAYLREIAASRVFKQGRATTATLKSFPFVPKAVEVVSPGAQSSIQDWPGRVGYWNVGVPPSGPMDSLSFRLANRLVGNPEGAPGLEMTLTGPTLRFGCDAVIALGGARMKATLDGKPVDWWRSFRVRAGQVLALGGVDGPGNRSYLAVAGGFDVPDYLGSGAAFGLGGFGGHATGTLRTGDVLRLNGATGAFIPQALAETARPALSSEWEIGVLYGPHGAPDFFTDDDIDTFFSSAYEVHFNSSRTGVRLIGPKPRWARPDGGEAGLHPSNIHDNAYAVGAIDFTGDMPIILGPDGPSLGGFVCPAVIVEAELWKAGQLKPGDTVRFRRLSLDEAAALRGAQDAAVLNLSAPPPAPAPAAIVRREDAVLARDEAQDIPVCYRVAGDSYLLVEYGPLVLDLRLRMRVHGLMQAIQQEDWPGVIDLTPGIRSLQIHYDSLRLPLGRLLDGLRELERGLPDMDEMRVPSRIVHLPLSWNDDQAQLAARKYQELVRPDAPWCPSNIEFIRRVNGLDSIDDVYRLFFDARYMVLGLGDVYLGAPVATPVDPRHRLVTTKYNPARTWTPENAVGIGGAYLCIYGMEGPGGYQLVGRTIQVWNTWRQPPPFKPGVPWLLRFFDQIRFFPVSAEELLEARADFPYGRYKLDIEETTFSLKEYGHFLDTHADGIAAFKARQQAAFEAERQRWAEQGLASYVSDEAVAAPPDEGALPDGAVGVESHVPGNVWKLVAEPGQSVAAGETLVIVESMKMELAITAPVAGVVSEYRCQPGRPVKAGQVVAVMKAA